MTPFNDRNPWTTCGAWTHPDAPPLDAPRLAALPYPGGTLLICKIRGKGRGLRAARNLAAGEILCADPVVVLPEKDPANRRGGRLRHYVFDWPDPAAPGVAVALGPSSLANHSDRPNAEFRPDIGNGVVVLRARRAIPAGREITVSYGWANAVRAEAGIPSKA
jgi:SET domain-containing protein